MQGGGRERCRGEEEMEGGREIQGKREGGRSLLYTSQ